MICRGLGMNCCVAVAVRSSHMPWNGISVCIWKRTRSTCMVLVVTPGLILQIVEPTYATWPNAAHGCLSLLKVWVGLNRFIDQLSYAELVKLLELVQYQLDWTLAPSDVRPDFSFMCKTFVFIKLQKIFSLF